MARDPNLPLLERVRYLSITSGILDEFFEIRVAGVKRQATFGGLQRDADELSAQAAKKHFRAYGDLSRRPLRHAQRRPYPRPKRGKDSTYAF